MPHFGGGIFHWFHHGASLQRQQATGDAHIAVTHLTRAVKPHDIPHVETDCEPSPFQRRMN
jgi:hypothetical protein